MGPISGLCSLVMVMMVMVVLGRGERRRGNHQQKKGGEQKFLHASNRSIGLVRLDYNVC